MKILLWLMYQRQLEWCNSPHPILTVHDCNTQRNLSFSWVNNIPNKASWFCLSCSHYHYSRVFSIYISMTIDSLLTFVLQIVFYNGISSLTWRISHGILLQNIFWQTKIKWTCSFKSPCMMQCICNSFCHPLSILSFISYYIQRKCSYRFIPYCR